MLKRMIRVSGFVTKEIQEVVRQPRLILSLLLGPFVILLLFGIGYTGKLPDLRAILVLPNDPAITAQRDNIRLQFSKGLDVRDVTTDLNPALARLRNNEVDVVIQVPADAAQQIGSGAQAIVPVYYNEIDPVAESRIVVGTLNYTNELNKDTVADAFRRGQGQAGDLNQALGRIDTALGRISDDIARGDVQGANQQASAARGDTDLVVLGAGLMLQLLQAPAVANTGTGSNAANAPAQAQNLAHTQQTMNNLNTDLSAVQDELSTPNPDPTRVHDRVEKVRGDVRDLQGLTAKFQQLNPYVLVAPFFGQARNEAGKPTFLNYYTPAVIALLLQHIALTLGALSMVRERTRGSIELFRVSPITPGEILTGKYLGFTLFLAVLAVALIALAVYGLGVPMLGDYVWLALALALLIFTSLGLGFGLSMISRTESQAVQLAMLVLLTSVFFSGFFLPLSSFWWPVQYAAYALPVTHGIISLQDIMLRGRAPDYYYPLMLAGLGALFAGFALWRFSREFRRG